MYLKAFVGDGELARNINKKKKPGVFQAYSYRCALVANITEDSISSIRMWNIVNQ